jgi:hypothetical protein
MNIIINDYLNVSTINIFTPDMLTKRETQLVVAVVLRPTPEQRARRLEQVLLRLVGVAEEAPLAADLAGDPVLAVVAAPQVHVPAVVVLLGRLRLESGEGAHGVLGAGLEDLLAALTVVRHVAHVFAGELGLESDEPAGH